MTRVSFLAFTLMATTALASCSMVPDYQRPDVETPQGWREGQVQGDAATINADWWKNFGSDELDGFMNEALTKNNDLLAAMARVDQARAAVKIAGAPLLPSVDGTAGGQYGATRTSGSTNSTNAGNVGLNISYELDLFGARRAALQASQAGYRGSVFDRDALGLVVMGDVARGYFTVLNAREQVRIAQESVDIGREVLRIVQARFDAGIASALDVSQQKTQSANFDASLSSARQNMAIAENALAVLLGRAPQSLTVTATSFKGLTTPDIPLTQPSSLLERRPDIRSAEASLEAANANIGVARAAYFPTIALGAGIGASASPIGDPVSTALSLAGTLTAPIFKGGQLEGGVEQATARQKELVETYRKAVLVSFREVEDALAATKGTRAQLESYSQAVTQARDAYRLSEQLYKSGAVDFQNLLDAQRSLLSAEQARISAQAEMLGSAVDLYKALGGGWQETGTRP